MNIWTKGVINGYDYYIRHFEEGSEYGINGGKILVNYDRDWDIKPTDKEIIAVFKEILKQYN